MSVAIVIILELTGGTESESEASIQFYPQPLPLQRNQSLSNTNQVMRSLSISNPVSTISNVESRSGSISMRSQTSGIGVVYNSGIGRSSMSGLEGYSEYSSTMSIEERESPDNTGLPKTPPLSIGYLPFMEIDTFSTSRNQFNLDIPSADGLSGTLQADPAIFSENVNIHNVPTLPFSWICFLQRLFRVVFHGIPTLKLTERPLKTVCC